MSKQSKQSQQQEKKGLVPQLRFPEFRESGEWEKFYLSDVAGEKLSNGVFNDPKKVGSGFRLINVLDMYIDTYIDEKTLSLVDIGRGEFNKNKVQSGDIFFTRSSLVKAGIAHSNIYLDSSENITFDGHLIRLRPNKKLVFPLFLHFSLKSESVRSQLISKGKSATMTTIGQSDIADTYTYIPLIAEQQKIADCLSALDELITAQSQKAETLKAHKKGLMQQLFPAAGETVPKLRFAEFRESGEWEQKTLNKVCKINPSSTKLPDSFVYIDLESVVSGVLLQKKVIVLESAPSRAQRLLTSGDVIFQMVRPYQKNNFFFQANDEMAYVASTGYAQLRARESKMYLFQYLHNDRFVNRVLAQSTGSNYPAINSSDLANIRVEIPKLEEQQKIADCLSFLDQLITAQNQKIEALKAHKKGLMQQLFPAVDG